MKKAAIIVLSIIGLWFMLSIAFDAGYEAGYWTRDGQLRKVKGDIQQKSTAEGWQIAGAGADTPIRGGKQ